MNEYNNVSKFYFTMMSFNIIRNKRVDCDYVTGVWSPRCT